MSSPLHQENNTGCSFSHSVISQYYTNQYYLETSTYQLFKQNYFWRSSFFAQFQVRISTSSDFRPSSPHVVTLNVLGLRSWTHKKVAGSHQLLIWVTLEMSRLTELTWISRKNNFTELFFTYYWNIVKVFCYTLVTVKY